MKKPKPRVPQTCAENTQRKSKFSLGDVVELVTGSFAMVVAGIERGDMVRLVSCQANWLNWVTLPEKGLRKKRIQPDRRKAIRDADIPF